MINVMCVAVLTIWGASDVESPMPGRVAIAHRHQSADHRLSGGRRWPMRLGVSIRPGRRHRRPGRARRLPLILMAIGAGP
jgi:hypothetical protein